MQQPMPNPEDISDPKTIIDMAMVLMAKAFKLYDTTSRTNNQISSSNPNNRQIAQPGMNMSQDIQMLMFVDKDGNQFRQHAKQHADNQNGNKSELRIVLGITNQNGNGNVAAIRAEDNGNGNNENQIRCYNCQGVDHYAGNCRVKPRKKDVAYLQTQLQIAQQEEVGIQLNSEEFDFMATAGAYDEIEEVIASCILKDNLQQASTSGTQTDSALVYDSDGSAE
nr:hypothetical protein [Tanacetum cinerariifolium]